MYCLLLLGMRPAPYVVSLLSEIPLVKFFFLFASCSQLETVSCLGLGWELMSTSPPQCGNPIWPEPVHGTTVPSGSYVSQSCCVWKTCFSWCLPSSLPLTIFLPSFPDSPLNPERRGLVNTYHLGRSVPEFLTLCTLSSFGSSY